MVEVRTYTDPKPDLCLGIHSEILGRPSEIFMKNKNTPVEM